MAQEPRKAPERNQSGSQKPPVRMPRGLGGVILITALLLALFVMVHKASLSPDRSLYEFWRNLLNARQDRVVLGDTSVALEYRERGIRRRVEAAYSSLTAEDKALIQDLAARQLTKVYPNLQAFADDLPNIHVASVWLVTEMPKEPGPATPGTQYLTAILTKGNVNHYTRIDAEPGAAGAATLSKVLQTLRGQGVPIRPMALSQNPQLFQVEEKDTALIYLISTIGPWILFIGLFWFFIIRQMRSPGGAGSVLSFGRSRATLYTKEHRTNITFEDVAGVDEAKDEVKEIIEFLKNPGRFQKLGGRIPRGVLLVGSPGCGKTLLAKAIAGEAEVPFFSISGSDFVEMFVGVGASRVRDLFKQAKENSPCIIFLDEIDAVGRKRGSGLGGGHDEREQTLNAILVEMDGFDTDEGIIMIGATNRPDVLDPALLRPGRFDRQIVIDMPDVKGREEILRVHARKVKMAPDVDLTLTARATPTFSGADLAAVINEAAILAGMKRKEYVEHEDLEEARDRIKWGREKKSRQLEEQDRRVTAYHEAGHALVAALIPEVDPVHKVTIISRGMALGATMSLPARDDYHMRKSKLLGVIAMSYGGRVAEAVVFGDISAGAQNDIQQATRLARMMVAEFGMSDAIGPVNYAASQEASFLGKDFAFSKDHSEETASRIDLEVRRILDECYQRAERIVRENREKLDRIAEALLKHETLAGQEVAAILRGDNVEDFRRAVARQKTELARSENPAPATPVRGDTATGRGDVGLSGAPAGS